MTDSVANKLREAVAKAYEEGFHDGADHGNLEYKYPPMRVAWLGSEARGVWFPERTEAQSAELKEWQDGSHAERYRIAERIVDALEDGK